MLAPSVIGTMQLTTNYIQFLILSTNKVKWFDRVEV